MIIRSDLFPRVLGYKRASDIKEVDIEEFRVYNALWGHKISRHYAPLIMGLSYKMNSVQLEQCSQSDNQPRDI